MKFTFKDSVLPALTLTIICAVMTLALAGTNELTKQQIADAQLETAAHSRMVVLPEADEFTEADGYYEGAAGGNTVGYVFETSSNGYGGQIDVMTGISADGRITGVTILNQNETPGLGANILNEGFTAQYMQNVPEHSLEVVKNQIASDGEIEALTGATISSNAVTNAVNQAVEIYNNEIKGGE